ncbi:MAG: sugar phosphate nucleotidyltransferase [Phycisphaerae bacterium]
MSQELLPVAILAGGLATRLGPLTKAMPKSLLDVAGEPFIAHQLHLLKSRGARRVVLCVGYLGEMIQDFVKDGAAFGLEVAFSFDGPKLLGTGGAIKRAIALLGDEFFVMYGDSYLRCDYRAVQATFEMDSAYAMEVNTDFTDSKDFREDFAARPSIEPSQSVKAVFPSSLQGRTTGRGALALMTIIRNDDRWDRSNVEFRDGRIVAHDKKNRTPAMRHVDYGLGVFRREAFDFIEPAGACDLAEVYSRALAAGRLAAYEVSERFYEIGSVQGLEETRALLSGRDKEGATS